MYVLVTQSCPTLCDPMDYSLPGSSVHGISLKEYGSGLPFPSPGDFPNPGIEPESHHHTDYLTYIQTTPCKILGWMNHKLESRLPGEIPTTLDVQMIPL